MWTPKPTDSSDSAQTPGSTPASSAPLVDERRVVSWVGKAVVFKGELFSSEDMRIEGRVEGTIDVRDHDLIVGPNATINADVVGPICESGDFLAKDREIARPRRNDLLAVMSAGAYGFTMASNYNSHPKPPEVLVDGDRYHIVRKRETLEDLINGEMIPASLQ